MKKYMLLAVAMLVPSIAHAGNTRIVVPFTGTFGSSAFGDYKPGDKISGTVSYERIFNSYGDGLF